MATIMEIPLLKGNLRMHIYDIAAENLFDLSIGIFMVFIGFVASKLIYNIYFHPLSRFPGPKLAAATPIWHSIQALSGKQVFRYQIAHEKYGPVVRVAPNELSFSSAAAWKDIYGHHPRTETFLKSDAYNTNHKTHGSVHLVSVKDIDKHAQLRRLFAHAFSAKSLSNQEVIVDEYINIFIQKLGKRYAGKERGPDGELCNIVNWFNYTTFDIIGDLAFGSSAAFDCLKNERAHEWVTTILGAIRVAGLRDVFRRYPFMMSIGTILTPKGLSGKRDKLLAYANELVQKRLAAPPGRKDFFSNLLDKPEFLSMHHRDVVGNAQVLVIAGSETTATALSGTIWYLLQTPHVYQKLQTEVRTSFTQFSEINNLTTTSRLPYLNAVIEEGLRLYPPVGTGLPRTSPGAKVAGHYIPPGVDVSVHIYTAARNPENFQRPEEFIPERWIDPAFKETDRKEASQPFSIGPRGCLGRNLAYMELRLILARLIWMYNLELVDKNLDWIKANVVYALWSKPSLHVKINFRDGLPEGDRSFEFANA